MATNAMSNLFEAEWHPPDMTKTMTLEHHRDLVK